MAARWFILFAIIALQGLTFGRPASPKWSANNLPPWVTRNTNDNFYLNVFFGMSVEKPEGWYALSMDELNALIGNAIGETEKVNKDVSFNDGNSLIPLFGFNAFPPGTDNGQTNANIIGLAENTTRGGKVDDDCEIVDAAAKMKRPNMKAIYQSECRIETVNGVPYALQESTWNLQDTVILKQYQYVRSTENGYVLTFSLTYSTEADKNTLLQVLNSIHFS